MTVRELTEALSLDVIHMADGDRPVCGAYVGDLLSWVMGRAKEGQAWITMMSNKNIVAVATLTDVSCILLCEGVRPDDGQPDGVSVAELAAEREINLLSSPKTAYELAAALAGLGV